MNISSRCEYACRAVVELAKAHASQQPVTATYIAEARAIPENYLAHILLQLKRAGIVKSVRGAQGGYLLGRDPDDISIGDIIRAIDGPILTPLPVQDEGGDDLAPIWRDLAGRVDAAMSDVSVQSVLDKATTGRMYYI